MKMKMTIEIKIKIKAKTNGLRVLMHTPHHAALEAK
jgi:hypothetical protein